MPEYKLSGRDPIEWNRFVRDKYKVLARYANVLGFRPQDVDDVVQETMTNLFGSAHNLQSDGGVMGYARTIMQHIKIDQRRKTYDPRRKNHPKVEFYFMEDAPSGFQFYTPGFEDDVVERVDMQNLFRSMDERERTTAIMRGLGYTHEQIVRKFKGEMRHKQASVKALMRIKRKVSDYEKETV